MNQIPSRCPFFLVTGNHECPNVESFLLYWEIFCKTCSFNGDIKFLIKDRERERDEIETEMKIFYINFHLLHEKLIQREGTMPKS